MDVMRIAIPVYDDRIAAVADFADTLMLVAVKGGKEISRDLLLFSTKVIPVKVGVLSEQAADILICGALSRPFAAMVIYSGIKIMPFISGMVEDVIEAFLSNTLADPRFFMPGHTKGMHWCSGRRCRRHGRTQG